MKMIKVDVTIMGKSLGSVPCQEGEEAIRMREAVAYLDSKMRALRAAGKMDNYKIAIEASLAMAVELFSVKAPKGAFAGLTLPDIQQKMTSLHEVVDKALTPQEDLF